MTVIAAAGTRRSGAADRHAARAFRLPSGNVQLAVDVELIEHLGGASFAYAKSGTEHPLTIELRDNRHVAVNGSSRYRFRPLREPSCSTAPPGCAPDDRAELESELQRNAQGGTASPPRLFDELSIGECALVPERNAGALPRRIPRALQMHRNLVDYFRYLAPPLALLQSRRALTVSTIDLLRQAPRGWRGLC
jgi:hypothetical protein